MSTFLGTERAHRPNSYVLRWSLVLAVEELNSIGFATKEKKI